MPSPRIRIVPVVCAIVVVSGCTGPRANLRTVAVATPLPARCEPFLVLPNEAVPADARLIGHASYGDTGISVECSEPRIKERLRLQACRSGANVVRLVKESGPNFGSTCYRVKAELYLLGVTPVAKPSRVIDAHPEFMEKLTGFE